ncbi:hypothetical protein AJ79_01173 [Helicocarpus griseus UAMH5409]|uniref:Protein-lysine N-methyltransferase EFM4 n=1 Tax=Helicocarpus griseus UAMH5409 TaxID=1447875 RepID=A0A2B7Y7V8_9EURO|nr:hypothetical protein AJ79_01173 [Helicocarpus griseus UAMH5409]
MSATAPAEGVDDHPPHLEPSQLGTKEYWESFYDNSLSHLSSKRRKGNKLQRDTNQQEDEGNEEDYDSGEDEDDDDDDPGTSWFTEHNAPEKVMTFLTSPSFPLAPCNNQSQSQSQPQPTILDLGTGNGSMLALLRDEGGFLGGRMVGVDYSPKSIELARKLHEDDSPAQENTEGEAIRFEVWDVFDKERDVRKLDWFPAVGGGFDIVLDKGTFDAISLSAEEVVDVGKGGEDMKGSRVVQRRVCEQYPGVVRALVRIGGFLVVTSCNWTEEELIRWFTRREGGGEAGDRLVVFDRVEYPKFRFGGQEGQGVCTVCFQRVSGS